MKVSSVTGGPPLHEWADSPVPAMIRANGARLAQDSAEPASRNWAPQAQPFGGAHRCTAKRVRAFIDGHFREPVRMADLCRATGGGVRTLQRCFKQCFGVTVTDYLKAMRLDAAHRDLITAHPSRDTVATIALRNGCCHLGRFSSQYRERFGQLPRETLRILAEIDVDHAPQALHPVCDAQRTHQQRLAACSPAVRAAKRGVSGRTDIGKYGVDSSYSQHFDRDEL